MFGPELIDQLKPRERRVPKIVRSKVCFLVWRQPRNFEDVTLVARRGKHFRGPGFLANFFVAEFPQKRGCFIHRYFNTQEFTRFLLNCVA
jgi:hypothetical protein